jgi:hypothetical protein
VPVGSGLLAGVVIDAEKRCGIGLHQRRHAPQRTTVTDDEADLRLRICRRVDSRSLHQERLSADVI